MADEDKGRFNKFQDHLKKQYTPIEEEYHNAYPDVRAPWTTGFLFTFFSRYGRGALGWGLVGVIAAIALWLLFHWVSRL